MVSQCAEALKRGVQENSKQSIPSDRCRVSGRNTAKFTGRVVAVPVKMTDSKMADQQTRTFDGTMPEEYWTWRRWMMGVLYADHSDKP